MSTGPAFDGTNANDDAPVAVICREPSANQTNFAYATVVTMIWDSILTSNSTGTVPLSYSNGVFTNTSGAKAAFNVALNVGVYCDPNATLYIWAEKSVNTSDYPMSYNGVGNYNLINTTIPLTGVLVLAANENFRVYLYSLATGTKRYYGLQSTNNRLASKITITQIK